MQIFRPIPFVALACLLPFGKNAAAANAIWDGGAGTALWSDANNWSPNGVPSSTTDVQFDDRNASFVSIDLNGNQTISSLTFSGGHLYEIKDNTLTITTGNITVGSASVTQAIDSNLSLSAASVIQVGSSAELRLYGTTTGSTLNKTGDGLLDLRDNTTFTGTVTISAGSLEITGGNFQAANIVNNAALNYAKLFSDATISAAISGSGRLNFLDSNSTLTLTGNNTFSGGVFFGNNTNGDIDTLQIGDGGTTGSLTSDVSMFSSSRLIFNRAGSLTYSGDISGNGQVTQAGAGMLTLSGTNAFSGGMNFDAGMTRFSSMGNLGTSDLNFNGGGLQWASGNTADISTRTVLIDAGGGTIDTNGNNVTFAKNIGNHGSGALTKTGLGSLTLSGANTYSGGTNFNMGAVQFTSLSNLGTGGLNFDGGTLKWGAGATTDISTRTITFNSGGATLDTGGNNVTLAAPIGNGGSGALTKTGSGSLTLSGTNTYTGGTNLEAGVILFSSLSNLGTGGLNFDGGTLKWDTGATTDISARTVTFNSDGVNFNTGGNDVTLANPIGNGGPGSLTKSGAGAIRLGGTNTFAGGITISAGSLTIGTGGASGSITSDVVNNSILIFNRTSDYAYGGNISGTGALYKEGSNTLTLSGTNTLAGVTHLDGGTLAFSALSNLGSGSLTLNGGTLQWASGNIADISTKTILIDASGGTFNTNGNNVTLANAIGNSGAGALAKTGLGTLTLGGNNTYTGGTNLEQGAVQFTSLSNLGTGGLNFDGGTLKWAAGATTDISTRAMTFNSGGATLDTNGNNVTFANAIGDVGTGTLTKTGLGTLTFSGNNTYTGTTIVSAGTLQIGNGGASGSVSGNITDNSALVFNRSGATYDYAGNISGSGSLTKSGAGTVRLGGTNTFAGGITINSGALTIGTGGTSGSITSDVVNNSILIFNRTSDYAYAGNISGTGALYKVSSNTLTLSGTNTLAGVTHLDGGTLAFSALSNLGSGSLTLNGGTLQWASGNTADISARTLLIDASGGTFNTNGNNVTLANAIGNSGTGALTKTGLGTLALGGNNTYSGGTNLKEGAVQFTSLSNLGTGGLNFDGGTLKWGSGATTDISTRTITFNSGGATLDTNGNTVTFANAIGNGGTGALTKSGAGTVRLGGTNTFAGGITINSGALTIGTGGTGGSITSDVVNNSILIFNRTSDYAYAGNISGTGALFKEGSNTLTLSGTNTYAGATHLEGGTLAFSALSNLGSGSLTFNGGTLQWASGNTADISTRTVLLDPNGGTLDTNGNDITLVNPIGNLGTGGLTKTGAGTLTLVGNNTYAGSTTISEGTLTIGKDNSGSVLGDIINNSALVFNRGDPMTYAGVISGSGTLTQAGTGTLILTGTNTYSGTTTVNSGRTINIGDGGTTGSIESNLVVTGTVNFNRSNDITYGGQITGNGKIYDNGSGTLTLTNSSTNFTGIFAVSGGGTLRIAAGADPTFEYIAVGHHYYGHEGSLTIDGPGSTLTLEELEMANSGTGILNITNGGALNTTDSASMAEGNYGTGIANVSGAGSIWTATGGILVDGGGAIDVNGTLNINDGGQVTTDALTGTGGVVNLDHGTLAISATTTFDQTLNLDSGGGILQVADGKSFTISSTVGGTGGLTKTGAGTLTLGGNNTYAGLTTISQGALQMDNSNAVSGDILDNASLVFGTGGTYAGTISGIGSLTKNGGGRLILTGSNTYSGGTTINGGDLQLGTTTTGGSITGDINLTSGSIDFESPGTHTYSGNITGNGWLYMIGTGTTIFTGNSHFENVFYAHGGNLRLENGTHYIPYIYTGFYTGGDFSLTVDGPATTLEAEQFIAGYGLGTTAFTVSGGALATMPYITMASGYNTVTNLVVTGSGSRLEIAGDIAKGNGTGGSITVSDGAQLTIGGEITGDNITGTIDGGAIDFYGSGTTTIPMTLGAAGGTIAVTSEATHILSGNLTGSGGLTKTGAGTLTLTGGNLYTGDTTVSEGALQIDGSLASTAVTINAGATLGGSGSVGALTIASGGTLAPGHSPGTLNAGDTTFAAGGTYQWQISDANGIAGTNWDLLAVTGTLDLSGLSGASPFTIALQSLTTDNAAGDVANFDATRDYSYTLATASGGILGFNTGDFTIDASAFTNALAGGSWSLAQIGNNLNLNFTAYSAVPEPSTYAAVFGILALALAAFRRRRIM